MEKLRLETRYEKSFKWKRKRKCLRYSFQLFISPQSQLMLKFWLLFSTFNGAGKRLENKQTKSFLWSKPFLWISACSGKWERWKSDWIYFDFYFVPLMSFYFNYDELSGRLIKENTDNKLHICDNHLEKNEAWESLNGSNFSMDKPRNVNELPWWVKRGLWEEKRKTCCIIWHEIKDELFKRRKFTLNVHAGAHVSQTLETRLNREIINWELNVHSNQFSIK